MINISATNHLAPRRLVTTDSDLPFIAEQVLVQLKQDGIVFLDFKQLPPAYWCERFLSLGKSIGQLIEHNPGQKDYLWTIRKRNALLKGATFSQHAEMAFYHTDAQYRNEPDQFLGLLCIQPANCGGGVNYFQDFAEIRRSFEETINGRQWLQMAQEVVFPFLIPPAFRLGDKDYLLKPILTSDYRLRFRMDTIQQALERYPQHNSKDHEWLLTTLYQKLKRDHTDALKVKLTAGGVVFLDNHRWLHARTAFNDTNRHLKRIRLDAR